MNRFILMLCVLFIGIGANAQNKDAAKEQAGMDFFHGTWAEVKEEAKKQDKYIVVDAYASWCGPCKKMARTTFVDPTVGDFYNKNFISFKVDMEKGEGPSLRNVYRVNSYPTIIYYNPAGEEVRRFKGYRPAAAFLAEGKKALFNQEKLKDYVERFEQGEKSDDFLREYISYSSLGGEISEKAAKAFIKGQKKNLLKKEENIALIYDGANDIKAPFFDLVGDNRALFDEKFGKDAVTLRLRNAAGNAFLSAVEKKDVETVEKSIEAMKKVDFEQQALALLQMDLELFKMKEDYTGFAERAATFFEKDDSVRDFNFINSIAWTVYENVDDKKYLEKAEQWARKSVQLNNQYHNNDTLAALLLKQGKLEEGKIIALRAIDLAKRSRKDPSGTKKLMEQYGVK